MSSPSRKFIQWSQALLLVTAASAGMLMFRARLDKAHVALVYVLVVLGGSALGGRAVGLGLSAIAFLLFNFLFLPPYNTLTISDPLDWLVLATFLITGVVAAELIDRERRQSRLAEERRAELDTAEEERRTDRLKDALLAAVSHDLRTPLTTIKAIAHEIAAAGSERAVIIEEEADRLAKLVEGLLELSELNAGVVHAKLELNTVDELVGAALERCGSAIKERQVETDLEQWELLVGYFDFASSLRILTNLLENAAKYSPANTPISVTARRNDRMLEISVSDRGDGIPEAERSRIFEPFYRVPGATADVRGAGLGLSISKRLAKAQGGDLLISSRDGGGSVFTLRLNAGDVPVA